MQEQEPLKGIDSSLLGKKDVASGTKTVSSRVVELLVAGGMVPADKIEQARNIALSFSDTIPDDGINTDEAPSGNAVEHGGWRVAFRCNPYLSKTHFLWINAPKKTSYKEIISAAYAYKDGLPVDVIEQVIEWDGPVSNPDVSLTKSDQNAQVSDTSKAPSTDEPLSPNSAPLSAEEIESVAEKILANHLEDHSVAVMDAMVEMYKTAVASQLTTPPAVTQEEIDKAVYELGKQSTAPDRETPNWMQADIRRGIMWALSRLSSADTVQPRWVPIEESQPQPQQDVAFIVKSLDPYYDGRKLGGRYLGFNYGYHEFAAPGHSYEGSHWFPLPGLDEGSSLH